MPGASTASPRATSVRRHSSATTSPPSPRRTPTLLRALFAPDGVLDVDGDVRRGHAEVLSYYIDRTFAFEDFRPTPGPLHVDGTTVTVDIDVHLGGADRSVRDVFETDGSHITAVRVRGFADVLRAATAR